MSTSRNRRWPYLVLAYVCLGLALAGVVLPGLPTTPFLLVAAWAGERGSERLHRWLHRHPRFGPLLHHWRRNRAVPRRAKALAVLLMLVSWLMLYLGGVGPLWLGAAGLMFLCVGGFLLSRPEPTESNEGLS